MTVPTRCVSHLARRARMPSVAQVFIAGAIAFGLGGQADALSPPTVWTSRFEGADGIAEPFGYMSPALLSTGSGALFAYRAAEPAMYGATLTKLDPATALPLWSVVAPNLGDERWDSKLVALDDGSTFHLGFELSRFSASGDFVWAARGEHITDFAATPAGDVVVIVDEGPSFALRRLSGADGTVQEARRIPRVAVCGAEGSAFTAKLTSISSGVTYLGCGEHITQVLLSPLRTGWTGTDGLGNVTATKDGSALYEWSTVQVGRRSIADGSVIWRSLPTPGGITQIDFDGDDNPISSGSSIDRWHASTGVNLWHVDEPGAVTVDPASASIFFAGFRPPTQGVPPIGVAGKIDAVTGATLWRSETPAGQHVLFKSLAVGTDRVHIAGITCTPVFYHPCKAELWNADSGSGELSDARGLVARTATAGIAVEREAGSRLFLAASEWGIDGPRARVRHVNEESGAVLADTSIEIPGDYAGVLTWHRMFASNAPDDRIAITLSAESIDVDGNRLDATLMAASTLDGQTLWQHALQDIGKLGAMSAPIVHVDGNVTVGIAEQDQLGVPFPTRRWIRHFAGGSGQLMWEREVESRPYDALISNIYSPPRLFKAGDCVLTSELFLGDSREGMKCLSLVDGSVRWANVLMQGLPHPVSSTSAVFVSASTSVTWRKFDITTGELLWQTVLSDPTVSRFSVSGTIADDAGSIYTGGTVRMVPDEPLDIRGVLVRLDETNGQITWIKRLDDNPTGPRSRVNPRFVANGKVYATQQIYESGINGLALTAFSSSDGQPQGSAFLYASHGEPHLPQLGDQGVYALTGEGNMLAGGQQVIPGNPSAFVMSNWGAPMPGVPGALDVDLSVQTTSVDGGVDHAFVFEANNSGSVDASQVQAGLGLPDGAIVRDLACSLGSAPCAVTMTAASVDGEFLIPSGQSLRITGIARLLPATTEPRFVAYAHGLHPFFEMDLKDNVATLEVDVLFRHGFEASATP